MEVRRYESIVIFNSRLGDAQIKEEYERNSADYRTPEKRDLLQALVGSEEDAKKIVETELKMKNTPLHAATVVGDTVGDPFKDTSSVAMNPVIKFTTLFGLLAVQLAVQLTNSMGSSVSHLLAAVFLAVSVVFVLRSFYGMRIEE